MENQKTIKIGNFEIGNKLPLAIIAGPCQIESRQHAVDIAGAMVEMTKELGVNYIFKASYDKANRTSLRSPRGVGIEEGMKTFDEIKKLYGCPILTDVHEREQCAIAAEHVDMLQIPAFLCRQTDLLLAASKTGKVVNIKKAQFLSGEDMKYPFEKARDAGATDIWLTERGNTFGYNNLVIDFRNIPVMRQYAETVIMDCTHSVQRPGGAGGKTGGDRKYVPSVALAAKAFGATGYFFEVHPNPDNALSDGPNMLNLYDLEKVIKSLI